MTGTLNNKVICITGASSGVGLATVRALLAEGAYVIGMARRIERLQLLAHERFLAIGCDIQNSEQRQQAFTQALAWQGRLDGLINNAGISRGGVHQSNTFEDLTQMLDTNVLALTDLTRLAIPALKQSQGTLINLSSTVVQSLIAGSGVYAATKAAVAAFSEVLRKELCGDNVRVTTIYPGMIETEFFDGITDEQKKQSFAALKTTLDPLQAQDIAEVIVFVLSRAGHISLNEIVIRPTRQTI